MADSYEELPDEDQFGHTFEECLNEAHYAAEQHVRDVFKTARNREELGHDAATQAVIEAMGNVQRHGIGYFSNENGFNCPHLIRWTCNRARQRALNILNSQAHLNDLHESTPIERIKDALQSNNPHISAEYEEMLDAFKKCLDELGEPCKSILKLKRDGYSDREITIALQGKDPFDEENDCTDAERQQTGYQRRNCYGPFLQCLSDRGVDPDEWN